MSGPLVRVLVVDDSAFARKVLREVLSAHPGIEVVDIARDGLEALEKIVELSPDVITLDLMMPNLDGVGVLRGLPPGHRPQVVVVSLSDAESELGTEALQLGAVALVKKPTALATDRLFELSGELVQAVLSAAQARGRIVELPARASPVMAPVLASPSAEVVVIGTSTGGPQALTHLLPRLPADLQVPVAVVLHIPEDYTRNLAARLDDMAHLEVVEARDGLELLPGRVVLARGGIHLKLVRQGTHVVCRLDALPTTTLHRPSVDVLFESAVEVYGGGVLGLVLTGMGDDGLRGAHRIHAAGGRILTESEDSCVVYGMPRTVDEAGLSRASAPIEQMAVKVTRELATPWPP